MNREDNGTDLGRIQIHTNVIESITALAACQIEGVKGIDKNWRSRFRELLDKKEHGAVKVDIDKNGEVWVEIPLIIKFGFNIPDVCAKVQENVRAALEKSTNLIIREINIYVHGIEKP